MEHFMEFYLMRVAIIAAVVVGLVILGIVLLVVLKKLGLLGYARAAVEPALQRKAQEHGIKGSVANAVLNRLDDTERC